MNILKDNQLPSLAKETLVATKIDLIRTYPFMGFLVMGTQYFFTDSLETLAATTEPVNTIFVNPNFMMSGLKTREERAFVLAHEVLHIFLEHIGRQRDLGYHHGLWNVATDYCINGMLCDMSSKMMKMPDSGLHDNRFKGMSADQVYSILLEENKNNASAAAHAHGDFSDVEGDGQGNDGDGDGSGQGNGGGQGQGKGKGQGGKGKRPFDSVSAEKVTDAKKMANRAQLSASLGQDSNIKNMGDGAATLMKMFEALLEPVIPWRTLLQDFITDVTKERYTYNRVSRRSNKSVIFPSMTGNSINLVFGIDTSGSMSSKDLKECMTELKSITDTFDSWNVTLLSCDTNAHVLGEYNSEDGDDWTTIDKRLIGGGGTNMEPMVAYANEMEEPPSVCIILTDGFIPDIPSARDGEIPTMVVVTKDGNKNLGEELTGFPIVQMNDA